MKISSLFKKRKRPPIAPPSGIYSESESADATGTDGWKVIDFNDEIKIVDGEIEETSITKKKFTDKKKSKKKVTKKKVTKKTIKKKVTKKKKPKKQKRGKKK